MRRVLERFAAEPEEHDPEHEARMAADCGAVRLSDCRRGEVVTLTGRLRMVENCARDGRPVVVAELCDGRGSLALVWLGRRRVGGVEAGRRLLVRGRVALHDGAPALFNPYFELRGTP